MRGFAILFVALAAAGLQAAGPHDSEGETRGGMVDVPWTTPGVRTTGRWHAETDKDSPLSGRVRCAWTSAKAGDSVELPFAGTAAGFRCRKGGRCQVWGLITHGWDNPGARIEAFVDGRSCGLFDTEKGDRFEVAKGLAAGRHVLRLVNRGRDGADARAMVRCFLVDQPQPAPRNWEVEDAALAAEVRALPPIAYVAQAPLESGAVPNAVWQSRPLDGRWGCAIRVIEPAKDNAVRTVFAETNSLIYDLSLSYDATMALFSMKRHAASTWQIYEIGLDGKGLRQLTDTPAAHNASPVYLAGGRIAFVSSRTPGYHQVCQPGPCMHLHVMDADGSNARRLSSNTLSDFCLCPLSDGRILYTRWSYIDWNLTYRQSLWTQYPDGRQLSLWFGNLSVDPASFIQAAELPDYSGVVALFAPHHNSPYGAIGSISNRNGPEEDAEGAVRLWTPELPCIYDTCHFWSWCHPFPVARDRVLAARGVEKKGRYVLSLLADDGRRATVYEDPGTSCFLPHPVVPRPAPKALADFVPAATNVFTLEACPPGQPEREEVPLARIVVSDVNKGLEGRVARGAATHIRVMEQLPKTVNRTWNGVLDQGPLLGASSYYAKRVWTYAPVAEDGSAHLEVPALKEIYLQLVDSEGREIRRMTDALNLMPGETQSCTGCHENRRTAAAPLVTSSARRAPTPLTPPAWGNAGVLDYVRVIQPVWDRNCVRCHSGANPPKGLSLSGGYTRFFNMSYDNLVLRSRSDAQSRGYFTGRVKEKPLVQGLHLLYGVTEPYEPGESGSRASRLPEFLTRAHCGAEVSAADRRRVFEWIDAQIPYYATSDHAHVNGKSGRDRWGEPGSAALKPWFTQRFLPLYTNSCARCHGAINLTPNLTNVIEPQWWWFDLSRPEWSPALTAHLPAKAGGRGCGKFAFTGTDDPVYRELKDVAREASEEAWKTPEADMPGFVPLSRGKCEYRP